MSELKASPRIRRIQRSALILLVLAGTINYVDRATLAIGGSTIRGELGLSIAEMGLLLSAFLWAYAFAQLPGGALIDRFGPRRLLAGGLLVWSVAQAAGGFVSSFSQFVTARVFLGLGEAPMFSSGARVVKDWYDVRSRGLPTGIFNCTSTLGPSIAPPLLTALMLTFGWRWMFIIVGIAGVMVAVAWFAIYREPEEVGLTAEEERYLTDGGARRKAEPITFAQWRHLFAFRVTWGLVFGFFGIVYLLWLFQAWLPGYLEMQRGLSLQKTGWLAAIPYLFGVVGSIGTGYVADRLMRAGLSPINSRRFPAVVALVLMGTFTYLAAIAPSTNLAVACIAVVMFGAGASSAMGWALVSVCAPENNTGSLGSIMNFGGYIGGALAPTVTGFIVQATGSFVPALVVGALIGLASAAVYLLVLPNRPITADQVAAGGRALPVGAE
ncbi:MFS transporter [Azorhizobium doebereinerae]|uniref:MFS transporter n=1 Tax=Azorhizobium doebereinerae TaxID=281091 RepID=UPI000404439B|nr:MFS transporter [Azorhizobium doebereinerae]